MRKPTGFIFVRAAHLELLCVYYVTMKTCTNCEKQKEYSEFYKDDYQIDGFKTFCKECDNAYSKAYYQKVKNNLTDKQKKRRANSYKRWKEKNYEKYLELQRNYREKRKAANK